MKEDKSLANKKYNHAFDFAFEVWSHEEDYTKITREQILAGLKARVARLEANPEEILEACGHFDMYETSGEERKAIQDVFDGLLQKGET
jgi:hypothetical protein